MQYYRLHGVWILEEQRDPGCYWMEEVLKKWSRHEQKLKCRLVAPEISVEPLECFRAELPLESSRRWEQEGCQVLVVVTFSQVGPFRQKQFSRWLVREPLVSKPDSAPGGVSASVLGRMVLGRPCDICFTKKGRAQSNRLVSFAIYAGILAT